MNQVRELVFYRQHFHEFFDKQSEKAKEKIDYILFLLTHIDKVPEKFLKHIEGQKGLYEIRVEHGNNIFRIFCCFDKGKIVILFNGYQKKSNKTSSQEIELANKLMKEYFSTTK
ncbi:MAG: type II toxin-antitoxin system RelE/ParE family toxin [Chitinophagaceae bacterium]|nr:type II toxin-antitoxin system RelE/ParE family toxin [Chitinophagaceae bacterium]